MGIYISGVKGLPEQVQANKEDIKTIKEEIEGIDFEEIRQLENQVAENTQDINNLEASIGVQNQAINGLKDRADALESKTQLMSYNDDLSKTDFRNSIEVADGVYATSLNVVGDGTIVNANGSGLHFQEGANDDTLTIANNDGAVQHFLHFNADGTLDIDGQPVGGGNKYRHNIVIYVASTYDAVCSFIIDNNDNTALNYNNIRQYIYDKAGDSGFYHATGYYKGSDEGYIISVSCNSTSITCRYYDFATNTIKGHTMNVSVANVSDNVISLQ